MSVASESLIRLDDTFVRELEGLYVPSTAAVPPEPRLLALDDRLAGELGLDADRLRSSEGIGLLTGSSVPEGVTPVAQAYAGHQFGGYSPRLGDGRALLLGELVGTDGRRRDLHLKGSGRTAFARAGDGKAAVGPMLREYLIGEAMHALGVPTSRALAVIATGEQVLRETPLPGAILVRVASSHIRVGTFEYAIRQGGPDLVRRLADYGIDRHFPDAASSADPYLAFLGEVVEAQASLISKWMLNGFIHGVMNTDNMAISGETIDYGPCAFMEAYDPATVYSSIDHAGRYAYGNQPAIALWNLTRFAETLIPLIDDDQEAAIASATGVLESFSTRYEAHWVTGMRRKLGLPGERPDDGELITDLLELLRADGVDFTSFFRSLAAAAGDAAAPSRHFADPAGFEVWAARWRQRVTEGPCDSEPAVPIDEVNPIYIPRNHLVEEALEEATAGSMGAFERLLVAVSAPFTKRPGLERYAEPAPEDFGAYQTFCGT